MSNLQIDGKEISRLFRENFSKGELGASVSIWQNGSEIISLGSGFQDRQKTKPWTADTRVVIWSTTKGLAAGTLLSVLESEKIPLEWPVSKIWPEFGAAGKTEITIGQLISHQAGLPGLLDTTISIFDHDAVCSALAAQEPLWKPGTQHGYHTRTFGFLLDEMVRKLTSRKLGEMWRELFGDPLNLDLWIGLPDILLNEVSPVYPARSDGNLPDNDFWRAMADPQSFTRMAFSTPAGVSSVSSMNSAHAHQAALPALGGVGTAQAIAKWYYMLSNGGEMNGRRYFMPQTMANMNHTLSNGHDLVILEPSAFSAGFMKDPIGEDGEKLRSLFGPSKQSFGHPGAGGSVAFADPENGISFTYVMNMVEMGVFPITKSLPMIQSIYSKL